MAFGKVALKFMKFIGKSEGSKKLYDATSDKLFSFASKHSLFTHSGELREKGMILVHMTDYAPKTAEILTDRAVYNGTRNSVHTAVNHAVAPNGQGTSWDEKKLAILMPFHKTLKVNPKGRFAGGMTTDLFTTGSLRIPKGTVIVRQAKDVPAGKFRVVNAEAIEEFKHLHGVRIIETADLPHSAVKSVVKKLGYQHLENPSSVLGGFGNPEKLAEDMQVWNKFAQKHGICPIIHSATPNMQIELLIDALKANKDIRNIPFQIIKDGKVLFDYKQEMLAIIAEAKKMQKMTNIPSSVNIDELEQLVKKAKNFGEIYDGIPFNSLYNHTYTPTPSPLKLNSEQSLFYRILRTSLVKDSAQKVFNIFKKTPKNPMDAFVESKLEEPFRIVYKIVTAGEPIGMDKAFAEAGILA